MSEIVAVMIAVAENVTVAKIPTGFLKKHAILLIKNTRHCYCYYYYVPDVLPLLEVLKSLGGG